MAISILRTVLIYLLVIFIMRFMGKRQIGTLQPSELAVTILMSNIASVPIENIDLPLVLGVVPILILLCFEYFFSLIGLKSRHFRKIICGKPIFVIEDGKINQKALNLLRFTIDDLTESLRGCGVFDISEVSYAIIETNGKMNIIKKFSSQPLTPSTSNMKEEKETTVPLVIISDGKPIKSNISYLNLSNSWLIKKLKEKNLDIKDVFLMTSDKNKKIFIVKKETK